MKQCVIVRAAAQIGVKPAYGPVEQSHRLVKNNKHAEPESCNGIYWQLYLIDPCLRISVDAAHFVLQDLMS